MLAALYAVIPTDLLLVGAVVILVVALGLYDGRFLVTMSLLCFASQMLNSSAVPALGVRLPAAACALALLLGLIRGRMPQFRVLREGVFPAVLAYLFLGVVTIGSSVESGRTTTALLMSAAAGAYAWILVSAAEPEEIRVGIRMTTGLIMLLSAAFLLAKPDVAIVGLANRWRGATDNANTLGVMSAFFFLSAKTGRSQKVSLVPTIIFVLGSAARTTSLGLAIISGPQLLRGRSRFVRRSVLCLALLAAIPLLFAVFFQEGGSEVNAADGSLTRLDNSRADSWAAAADSIKAKPLSGIGVGNDRTLWEEELPIHSSVLRPIAEVGFGALIPLALIARAGLRASRREPTTFRSIFAFMLVLGLFEGWLFAGGSAFNLIFIVTAYLATTAPRAQGPPVEPAERKRPAFSVA